MRVQSALGLLLTIWAANEAPAASLSGSVFLMPVETQFTSHGRAEYRNDLGQQSSATLTGTHRVTGATNYQAAVSGDGIYSYALEGPASPGACYGTSLSVAADPPGLNNTITKTWNGGERCAPPDEEPDELRPIASSVVVALSTGYRTVHKRDRWGNMFMYTSTFYVKEAHESLPRPYYDVFFTEQPSSRPTLSAGRGAK